MPDEAVTLHGLFLARVQLTPDALAYRHHDGNAWVDMTWREACGELARWQAALLAEGLSSGDRVGIMLRNCPQWVMFDQAALSLGLVVVPLYTVDRPDNIAYIVKDAGIKVFLFESAEQWWKSLESVGGQVDCLQRFISLDRIAGHNDARLKSVLEWLPETASLLEHKVRDRDALATIIYTSGTTGRPKGVMLSHYNIVYDAYAGLLALPIGVDDILLSFLPLSHTFERTVGYYISVMAGASIAFARSVQLLSEDFIIIRPTVLVSVPRIYERVHNAIRDNLEAGPEIKRRLFRLAVEIGWRRFEFRQGRAGWNPRFLLWPVLKRLVADKVMARLGGRLRMSVSGGAPLSPEISRMFIAMGLPILQGYGLTETSPIVSVNLIHDNLPASVGQPLKGVEVRIGELDALLVRGPITMMGYWNNPQATSAMISPDGWLNTGDTARIDAGGHIHITGRLKEIIVMSNGEKIPPAEMQHAILRDRLFEQVVVYGEGRPYLVALTVVNPEEWKALAQEAGINADLPESLNDVQVQKLALRRIAAQIREFPGYAKIHRVLLLTEPWSIENGMLTPTLKLKSARVEEKYAKQIQLLYEGH